MASPLLQDFSLRFVHRFGNLSLIRGSHIITTGDVEGAATAKMDTGRRQDASWRLPHPVSWYVTVQNPICPDVRSKLRHYDLLTTTTAPGGKGRTINWNEIAKNIPDRSNKDCRKRYYNNMVAGLKKVMCESRCKYVSITTHLLWDRVRGSKKRTRDWEHV